MNGNDQAQKIDHCGFYVPFKYTSEDVAIYWMFDYRVLCNLSTKCWTCRMEIWIDKYLWIVKACFSRWTTKIIKNIKVIEPQLNVWRKSFTRWWNFRHCFESNAILVRFTGFMWCFTRLQISAFICCFHASHTVLWRDWHLWCSFHPEGQPEIDSFSSMESETSFVL